MPIGITNEHASMTDMINRQIHNLLITPGSIQLTLKLQRLYFHSMLEEGIGEA
jgi:hypothetical protein